MQRIAEKLLAPYFIVYRDGEDYPATPKELAKVDCRRYARVPLSVMQRLVKEGAADPNETQNDSPSIKEFIDFAEEFQKKFNIPVLFHGYQIALRDDARVSVEGVLVEGALSVESLASAVYFLRHADEITVGDNRNYVWAWWD